MRDYFRSANNWLVLILACFICLVSAILITKSLEEYEASLHAKLMQTRTQLTRMKQSLYTLQSFAATVEEDKKLRAEVSLLNSAQSSWQSPLARAHVRLTDAVNQLPDLVGIQFGSVQLETLPNLPGIEKTPTDSEQLQISRMRLSANVSTVQHASQLLNTLAGAVYPYPFLALGCSYRSEAGAATLRMQCLINLAAWPLPLLNVASSIPHPEPSLLADSEHSALSTELQPTWRLFFEPAQLAAKTASSEIVPAIVPTKPARHTPIAHGVVTGPKGVIEVHRK